MGAAPGDGRDDRGFALLIVLWSSVLLAFLVTGITAAGRTEVQLAGNIRDAAVAELAADGAVQAAAFHLLSAAAPWPADGRPRTLPVDGAVVTLRIEDEGGKVNPNLAPPELLRALFQQLGLTGTAADALAGNVAAWRFPRAGSGFMPGLGAQTAEETPVARQYRAAGRDYEPPGEPFGSIDELGLVLGMTPPLLERLRSSLSLLAGAEPEAALAGPLVRRAMAAARPGGPPGGAEGQRRPPPPQAVTVVAEAVTPRGARFTRHAAIRLGRTGKEPPLTIVEWGTGPNAPAPALASSDRLPSPAAP